MDNQEKRLALMAVDLDQQIALEESRVTEGIIDACRTHTSMHDGYWKRLWELKQKRIAVQHVMEAFAHEAQ